MKVLTTGFWPSQSMTSCVFPSEIQDCCTAFKDFYQTTHTGRQLTWLPNMGSADVKAFFAKKRCELNVTTFQMAILCLFNRVDSMTVGEIRNATNIPDPELERHLLSLCTPKLPILNVQVQGGKFSDAAVVSYNAQFNNKLFKCVPYPRFLSQNFFIPVCLPFPFLFVCTAFPPLLTCMRQDQDSAAEGGAGPARGSHPRGRDGGPTRGD